MTGTARSCPICGAEFHSMRGPAYVLGNIREHLKHDHHLNTVEARKLLEERGIASRGYEITDQAIDDWNAMVKRGVIVQ